MLHALSTLALGPLLLWQGRRLRRTVPRLPEPPGDRAGQTGNGPPLRLLILGDSAAAGVGAEHQDQALTGRLVAALAPHFWLDWRLEAHTGHTTADALQHLQSLAAVPCDIVVASLGVNDVTTGTRPADWLRQQQAVITLLQEKFAARHIFLAGLPPMHRFPALPQPLRWYLGQRAQRLDAQRTKLLAHHPHCDLLAFEGSPDPHLMASDGFHPGPVLYAQWAIGLATRIRERWPS